MATPTLPIDPNAIKPVVEGATTLMQSGTTGYIAFGVVIILLGAVYIFYRKQINDFMVKMAQRATEEAAKKAQENALNSHDTEEAEDAQERLLTEEQKKRRAMFDAMDFETLMTNARKALGARVIQEMSDSSPEEMRQKNL